MEEPCESDESRPAAKADPTYLPAVEYFHSGTSFRIGDIECVRLRFRTMRRTRVDLCLCVGGDTDGDCHGPGVYAAECEVCAAECGCASARESTTIWRC